MSVCHWRSAVLGVVIGFLGVFAPSPAHATQKFGPFQLSGNLQSQNLIRHEDANNWGYVQNRNSVRIKLEYDWIEVGKFYGKYNIPFIENSSLFLLWRGVYDSIYDTTPGISGIQKRDIHGTAFEGLNVYDYARRFGNPNTGRRNFNSNNLGLEGLTHEERDILKFENQLREVYTDIKLRGVPLTIRAGRQQIVWGETDNFRMLDRANALNLTWHFQQEIPAPAFGWDEIRRPAWMIKFLYDLGDVWKLSQNFLEWYWNPGDWYPAKQTFMPRPWGLPFYNPLTNPIDGVFLGGVCANSSIRAPGGRTGMCTQLLHDTKLFQKGDYHRNPMENSQVAVRYHSMAPFGLEFTLNYFYQRFSGDDGTNYAPLRGLPKPAPGSPESVRINNLISQGVFPAEAIAPYVHTIGVSANYSDEAYTQTVFRLETIYDVGIPFFDVAKETVIDRPALPGVTKKNMWKGMIGFDRPTWIKTVNKQTTVFITGQFFWHHIPNYNKCNAQNIALGLESADECLVGGLDLPSTVRLGQTSTPNSPAFRDKVRDWETLATLAAFTFYRGGSVVPLIGLAIDPTNQFNMEPFWTIDWFVTDAIVLNLAQRYFVTPRGYSTPIFETWGLAGLNSRRSETSVRVTFQF